MVYNVKLTVDAEADLDRYIKYLLFVKKNEQAASNLLDDFEVTKNNLKYVANSLNYCSNPRLKEQKYRRINFLTHRQPLNTLLYMIGEYYIENESLSGFNII